MPAPEYTPHSKYPHRRKTPSFSSSLLDSIFRSIDDDDSDNQFTEFYHRRTKTDSMQQWQTVEEEEITSLGRQIMMEKWSDNGRNRSRSICSYSTSSASSSGATFSSSYTPPSSNQLRQTIVPTPAEIATTRFEQTPKRTEGKFMRTTKQRALKIYGDLKKVKQPISPGGRISNFLNSILGSRTLKKSKLDETIHNSKPLKKSASVKDSISRSCSSKTSPLPLPPLRDGNTNSSKRSVRFYPVNVIVDVAEEDSRPCGDKKIDHNYKKNAIRENIWSHQSKNVIRKYLKDEDEDEDEDDDDAESCSSSDLFELDNVGIGAYYREELPVFGTTNLSTNLAIANGLIRY